MSLKEKIKKLVFGRGRSAIQAQVEDLKLRYREFKYLLRANNEVLNLIAEIESQMNGRGAVGLDFISSRYIAASAKVFKMILHLNRISGDRYRALYNSFDQIRHQIDDCLSLSGEAKLQAYVLRLPDVDPDLAWLSGSKAANLAFVGRLGLPVPNGFVVTAAAFRRVMSGTGLDGQVRETVMLLDDLSYQNLTHMSHQVAEKMTAVGLPTDVTSALDHACQDLYALEGRPVLLSLRSSAVGEDSDLSFAGQYRSVLNVPPAEVQAAYREVLSSLYDPQAIVYRRRHQLQDQDAEMAVLVLTMLDPMAAGVMYTRDPRAGKTGPLLINAVRGLGQRLVDGSVTPEVYSVARLGGQLAMAGGLGEPVLEARAGDGVLPTNEDDRPALTRNQAEELARMGLVLEEAFGGPQDVEWALRADGRFFILQSRPLQMLETPQQAEMEKAEGLPLILEGGFAARPGTGSGPAHLVLKEDDLADFPPGGVLVARKSSPVFACVLDRATAVVTDVGGVTGHMASLTREFGVPALVGCKDATRLIRAGQIITVNATSRRVYAGQGATKTTTMVRSTEKPKITGPAPPWYKVARLIAPLTLTDPKAEQFRPDGCRTFHDIIRFVHEKSFSEMFRLGDALGRVSDGHARKLAHRLPFALLLIDLGGGLMPEVGPEVTRDEVTSIPGKAFLAGLLDPRIHWDRPRPVSFRGMASVFSRSMLTPPSDGQERDIGDTTYAILSAEYLNFNSRVGYHFAALDSVCGPMLNDNYISFRFQGGAATADRRVLRAELISRILARLGFEVRQTSDMVQAFVKKYDLVATAELLADLGRLTIFTRQMDMLCHNMSMVEWLAQAFASGNFNLDADHQPDYSESATNPEANGANALSLKDNP